MLLRNFDNYSLNVSKEVLRISRNMYLVSGLEDNYFFHTGGAEGKRPYFTPVVEKDVKEVFYTMFGGSGQVSVKNLPLAQSPRTTGAKKSMPTSRDPLHVPVNLKEALRNTYQRTCHPLQCILGDIHI